jgi:hypothetical protein
MNTSILINKNKFRKESKSNNIKEELIKNNHDVNQNKKENKKVDNIYCTSRKYSKDSSNLSTSNEDISEKAEKNNNFNTIYKAKAYDFKRKYRTELCKYYEMTGKCKYGAKCAYAHGIENLRTKVTNTTAYRTKKCKQFFENGYCPYGSRCQFAHQIKDNIMNNPYDINMSYQKILDIISKIENVRNIKKLVEKPRLKIFKEISCDKCDDNNKSRLLDDIKELDMNHF